jgi:hypothetical protein
MIFLLRKKLQLRAIFYPPFLKGDFETAFKRPGQINGHSIYETGN